MRFDLSRFPIVVLTCPRVLGSSAAEDLRIGYAKLTERRERFVVITDTTLIADVPSPLVRKQLAEVLNEPGFAELQRQYQVGAALIIDSVLIRGALTALLWLWTPPSPIHQVKSLEEGIAWAAAKLGRPGAVAAARP